MTTHQTITVETIEPSTFIDDDDAIDAQIVAWGCPYGVTLAINPDTGELDRWGSEPSHWIHGRDMATLTREQMDQIVDAVRREV